MYFLKRSDVFQTEKPYAFRFPVESEDIQQTNMEMERKGPILITNMRGFEKSFSIETNGFAVLNLQSELAYEDFYDAAKVSTYFRELEALLKSHLGASHVEVFRHGLRKRHPVFPISTGEKYEYDQPTSVAHIDTTPQETLVEIRRQHGEKADTFLNKRSQWINIWRPLRGPLNDWPLAVCDASTVDPDTDIESADLLYPDLATENFQVYYNAGYKWYYLGDHDISEVIVFKQADTLSGTCPGVPHCSFLNPLAPDDEAPRESIEARALVYYDD